MQIAIALYDRVTALDAIAEIDTDKVSAEIPTPVSGVVRELLAHEGDTVRIGADIAVIEESPSATAPARPPLSPSKAATEQIAPAATATQPVVDRHEHSPAVRELAKKHGIDLATLAGSGTAGRITRTDVLRAIDLRSARLGAAPSPQPIVSASSGDDELVPLTRVRRLIAENMTLSKTTIPHAWQSQEVDMSGVAASRNANKERFQESEGFSLTFLPYVVSAAAAALRAHPIANSSFRPEGIVMHRAVNIGVAIGLEDGVIVPVIRGADGMSITALARAISDLGQRARTKKLMPDDLRGATFTVNNSGTFGTIVSYSVINPGQAGILTMGAIKDRVVALEGQIVVRPMMFLSFSLDHRVLDGLGGARFLSACRERLESIQVDTSLV